MTWKEFKELAEARGVTDDMDILYNDTSYPNAQEIEIEPQSDDNDGLRIW